MLYVSNWLASDFLPTADLYGYPSSLVSVHFRVRAVSGRDIETNQLVEPLTGITFNQYPDIVVPLQVQFSIALAISTDDS